MPIPGTLDYSPPPLSYQVVYGPSASGDTTGATDRQNYQSYINAIQGTGKTLKFPTGDFYFNGGLTITDYMSLDSDGVGGASTQALGTNLIAVAGATGNMINVNPGSLKHGICVRNLAVDLSAATGMTGFYATNVDNAEWAGLFCRDGATAFQLDGVQLFTQRDCKGFNQRTQGYYSSGASNVDIRFDNCVYEQTVGATWAATSGWNIANGASLMLYGCEALRSPSGSGNWLSYGVTITSAAATTWIFMVNSWFDAISDGTGANSANSAACNLTNTVVNVRATNCFFSASSSAGQKQRALRVNGGSDHQFLNCTFGGSQVEFATGNCTRMGISKCNFVQQFADPGIVFTGGAAPTQGYFEGNTLQNLAAGIVGSAADAASFHNWTGGMNTDG